MCRYSQTNSHYSRCGFQGRIIKVDGRDARQGEESEGASRVCPSFNALYDTLTNLSLVQNGDLVASASPTTGGCGDGMLATKYCQIGDIHSVFR